MKKPIKLHRRLDLEAPVLTPDGAGGVSQSWQSLGVIWAHFLAGTGRERQDGGVAISLGNYRVIVRANPVGSPSRPLADQRLSEGTRHFIIRAVTDYDAEGRYLMCHVKEEAAQ